MNKNGLTKKSNRVIVTDANKLPSNVGFPGNMRGKTRPLTKKELAIQKRIINHLNK